jgi:hypothetical protein
MAEITKSLFGIDPQEILARRDAQLQQQALGFAQLSPMEQAQMGFYQAGGRAGTGVSGLMGAQDPELAKAARRNQMLQGIDINDPAALKQAAQAAMSQNDYAAAQELAGRAMALEKAALDQGVQRSTIVKNLREPDFKQKLFMKIAEKATPASIAAAQAAGGDISMLDVPENVKVSTFGQMLVDSGLKPGTPEFQKEMEAFIKAEKEGKAKGTGNVNIGTLALPGSPIDPKEAAKAAGKVVGTESAEIENKYSAIDSLRSARDMLDEGIFSGAWGKIRLNVRKAFGENDPKVVRTEKFLADIGEVVIPRLKDFGGNDSNEEMKYLQKVLGGEISLESDSLKRILKSAEVKIQRGIERVKEQSKAAAKGTEAPLGPGPSRTAPAGTKENPIKLK